MDACAYAGFSACLSKEKEVRRIRKSLLFSLSFPASRFPFPPPPSHFTYLGRHVLGLIDALRKVMSPSGPSKTRSSLPPGLAALTGLALPVSLRLAVLLLLAYTSVSSV